MKSYSLLDDYYCMPRRLGCPIFLCIEKVAAFQAISPFFLMLMINECNLKRNYFILCFRLILAC